MKEESVVDRIRREGRVVEALEVGLGCHIDGTKTTKITCLSPHHEDGAPSAVIEPKNGRVSCKACGGTWGLLQIPVVRGIAATEADAARLLEDHLFGNGSNGRANVKVTASTVSTGGAAPWPYYLKVAASLTPPWKFVERCIRKGWKGNPVLVVQTFSADGSAGRTKFRGPRVDGDVLCSFEGEGVCGLINLPALLAVEETHPLALHVCGETDLLAVEHARRIEGIEAAVLSHSTGEGSPLGELATVYRECRVIVLGDTDDAGRREAPKRAAEIEAAGAASVRLVFPPHGKDAREFLESGGTLRELLRLADAVPDGATGTATNGTREWDEPISFRDVDRPAFPTKYLPKSLQEFVDAVSMSIQVAPDVGALAVLGVVSAAVAAKVTVRLRTDRVEPVNIWTASVLGSGERKSSVFSVSSEPLAAWERDRAAEVAPEVERAKQRLATIEAKLAAAIKRAANASGEEARSAEDERDDLAAQKAAHRVVEPYQLIMGDATPESAAAVLAAQGGRAALVTDEAATFFDIVMGRYAKDGRPNIDVFLQSYSQSPIRVNRVGRPPLYLPRPCLTIATTMQPRVLENIGAQRELIERGLLPRFQFGLPASRVGDRDVNPAPMPAEIREMYGRVVRGLCDLPEHRDDDGQLVADAMGIDDDAAALLRDFAQEVETAMRPGGRFEHVREWASRLEGNTARNAALLHLYQLAETAEDSCQTLRLPLPPVTLQAVERAVALTREYFIAHGLAAFARMGADPAIAGAQRLLGWLQRKGLRDFSRAEAHRDNEAWAERAVDLDEPLRVLEEHQYIRPPPPEARAAGRPGRPGSQRWEVSPRALEPLRGNR